MPVLEVMDGHLVDPRVAYDSNGFVWNGSGDAVKATLPQAYRRDPDAILATVERVRERVAAAANGDPDQAIPVGNLGFVRRDGIGENAVGVQGEAPPRIERIVDALAQVAEGSSLELVLGGQAATNQAA